MLEMLLSTHYQLIWSVLKESENKGISNRGTNFADDAWGTALIVVLWKVMQDVGLECVESSVYLNDTSECIYTYKIYSFYQVYMMYIISVLQNVIIKFI